MLILPLVFSWKRRTPSAGSAGHRLRIHAMDKAQAFPVLFLSRTLTHSLPPSRPSLHSLARARACMCVLHVLSRTFLRETSCARERARAVCMCVYPRARESCGLGVRAGCFCPFLPNPIIPRPLSLTHSHTLPPSFSSLSSLSRACARMRMHVCVACTFPNVSERDLVR